MDLVEKENGDLRHRVFCSVHKRPSKPLQVCGAVVCATYTDMLTTALWPPVLQRRLHTLPPGVRLLDTARTTQRAVPVTKVEPVAVESPVVVEEEEEEVDDDVCVVCNDPSVDDTNQIVYCDSCDVAVHQVRVNAAFCTQCCGCNTCATRRCAGLLWHRRRP